MWQDSHGGSPRNQMYLNCPCSSRSRGCRPLLVTRSITACRPASNPSFACTFQHLLSRCSHPYVRSGCNISTSFEQRPMTYERATVGAGGGGGGGGDTDIFSSPGSPQSVRGGSGAPSSSGSLSTRSPLFAVRPGAVKRPSSGSLPVR